MELTTKELKGLLKFLAGGVRDDTVRISTTYVHVSDDRKTYTCTDGYQLRRVTLANPLNMLTGVGNGLDAGPALKCLAAGASLTLEPLEGFPDVSHMIPPAAKPPTHDARGVQQPQEKRETEPCHGMDPALLGGALSDTAALMVAFGDKGRGVNITVPQDALSPWRVDCVIPEACTVCVVVMPMRA